MVQKVIISSHHDAQCMISFVGSLKCTGKVLGSWFRLQEDSPVLFHVDLANLATQATLWSCTLAQVKNKAGI